MTPVVQWQSYDNMVAAWKDLPDQICDSMENAFKDATIDRIQLTGTTQGRNWQSEFNKRKMTFELPMGVAPVRRCKQSDIYCSFFDGYAWCYFNSSVSAFLIDAKAYGHTSVRFYVDCISYDAFLQAPATQVNRTTGTVRAIYIPSIPSTEHGDESDADFDDAVDLEKLDETVSKMPDTLSEPLMCPITQRVMLNPVVAADGHTYEKEAIVRWLISKDKSPLTGEKLNDQSLRRNHNIRKLVSSFVEKKIQKVEKKKKKMVCRPAVARAAGW